MSELPFRWRALGNCWDTPAGTMFPVLPDKVGGGTDHEQEIVVARRHCLGCPVDGTCLDAGLWEDFGVWGGLTSRERRRLRTKLAVEYVA